MKKKILFFIAIMIPCIASAETIDELIRQREVLLVELSAINEKIAQARKSESPERSLGRICDIFPDEVMALTVRDACGKFSIQQEVTADDLSSVREIEPELGTIIKDLTGIGYLTNLISIRLDWYRGDIREFPDEMRNCTNLCFLDIQEIGLTKFPEWIDDLSNLWRIDASGNNLSELPDSICSLTNLHSLDISSNKAILRLPDNIGNLTNLSELKISYTGITVLPDSIYTLNLKTLEMKGLPIK